MQEEDVRGRVRVEMCRIRVATVRPVLVPLDRFCVEKQRPQRRRPSSIVNASIAASVVDRVVFHFDFPGRFNPRAQRIIRRPVVVSLYQQIGSVVQ